MIRLTRTQLQPIGVDIGFDSVKMLQLECHEQSLSVVAAAKQPMPAESQEQLELRLPVAVDLIRQMMRQAGFRGREIVAALPREILHVKNLRLPMIPAAEIDAAVHFEARNIFPFDTEQAYVRHLYAGEVRQGSETRQEVIVLAAKHEDVDLFVEQLHRTGCQIVSVDFEPSSLYRGIERFIRRREDEHEVHVLIDVGARRSQVIIGKGRDISFFKPIDIGAQQLHESVARKLQISLEEAKALRRRLIDGVPEEPEKRDPVRQAVFDATRSMTEELAREISLCLRYYSVTFRGQRPGKVRLMGGEAEDPQLLATLVGALPIPVEVSRPLFSVNTASMKQSDRRGNLSEWAVALGLGLKMTRSNFGARDGVRRDAEMPPGSRAAGAAEVIDLSEAIQGPAPEVVHA